MEKTDSKYLQHLKVETYDSNENFEIFQREDKGFKLIGLEGLKTD